MKRMFMAGSTLSDEERDEYWRIERRNEELMALNRASRDFNFLFFQELDRFCHRCGEEAHKCSCAEAEDDAWDGWDDRTEAVESGDPMRHERPSDGEWGQ